MPPKPETSKVSNPPMKTTFKKVDKKKSQPPITDLPKEVSKQDEDEERREALFLVMRIEEMKKKNERAQVEQEMKYGITIDAVKDMQKDLDHAKAVNNNLLGELELRKARYDRLEADMVELKKKFEECQTELKELKREQKKWRETEKRLGEAEKKYQALMKTNRALKTLLWKNSLHPEPSSVPNTASRKQLADSNRNVASGKSKHMVVWR